MPILSCLMNSKNEKSYYNIFENLKIMLQENNINIDFSKINIMSENEKGLRAAIKKAFPNSSILGCFYHYIKAIFFKCKKLGLITKKYFFKTYKLLIFFKIYPFIFLEEKIELTILNKIYYRKIFKFRRYYI